MRNSLAAAVLSLTLTNATLYAGDAPSTRTPEQIVRHHISAMLRHDARELAEDYADDAVMVLSANVVSGRQQIQRFFESAAQRRQPADDNATFKVARIESEAVIEEWSHKAADGSTVNGADVIVVRYGKIVFHCSLPAAAPAK